MKYSSQLSKMTQPPSPPTPSPFPPPPSPPAPSPPSPPPPLLIFLHIHLILPSSKM